MKNLIVIAALLISTAALAQDAPSLHITAKRRPTATDAHHVGATILEGDIGNQHYTLDEADVLTGMPFEVGHDYPVVKVDDNTVRVRIANKHGREITWGLPVMGVQETAAK
jgi:hypothetical protein